MLTSPNGKSYIGQTTRPIQTRFEAHQQRSGCRAIYNAIQKYGWDNFEKDWYECPDEDLDFDEELLVREMGTLVPWGYNLKEGGGANGKMSDESRQRMSDSMRGEKNPMYGKTGEKHPMYGKTPTEETRQKISKAQLGDKNHMFGKTPNEQTKQKLRESRLGEKNHMFGKTPTDATKQKMSESKTGDKNSRSKKIYQYDLNGTYIQSFGSCGEAAGYLNKKDGSKISECARGEQYRKTSYGFKWSYDEIFM